MLTHIFVHHTFNQNIHIHPPQNIYIQPPFPSHTHIRNHIACVTLFETFMLRPTHSYATYILFSQIIRSVYIVWLHGSHAARPIERERFLFLSFTSFFHFFYFCLIIILRSLIIIPLSRVFPWCFWKFILYRYLRRNLKLTNVIYRTAEFINRCKNNRRFDLLIGHDHQN